MTLSLGVLSDEQADGALARVDMSLIQCNSYSKSRVGDATASLVVSLHHVDEDTGCFLLTLPRSNERKVIKLFVPQIISIF